MKYIVGGYSQLSLGTDNRTYEVLLNREIKPILTLLYNNPSYKFLLRLSCAEFEWLDQNHPEINMLINDLIRKGQLELLSSTYHDSILSLLPTHERSANVENSTTYLRKKFGKRPRGLWINYQDFTPSVIPVMELSSLDYIVMSTYNQSTGKVLFNKPFEMSEFGKNAFVFPFDDNLSKLINDSLKSDFKVEKVKDDLKKYIKNSSNALNTFMLNLDYLARFEGTSCLVDTIYNSAGNNSTVPSLFLEEYTVSKNYYIPAGIYGRDYAIGKALCLNERIIDSNVLRKIYFAIDALRGLIKNTKKSLDIRRLLDELLMEACSATLYVPYYGDLVSYKRYVGKKICELEKLLVSNSLFPDTWAECYCSFTKNLICFLIPKGGIINKVNYCNSLFDLTLNSDYGLFYSHFKSNHSSKSFSTINKNFDIQVLDKKHNDFLVSCPIFEFEDNKVSIIKKYKFRQNYLSVDYEIKNVCNKEISDYQFETLFNLSLPTNPDFNFENTSMASFSYSNTQNDLDLFVGFSYPMIVTSKDVTDMVNTINGNIIDYKYTQFKILNEINLKPSEILSFSVIMKIDKVKGDKNDIK